MQKTFGQSEAEYIERFNPLAHFRARIILSEARKRGIKPDAKNLVAILSDKKTHDEIFEKAKHMAKAYLREKRKAERLNGIGRLKQIQKMRNKFAYGMTLPQRFRPIK